MLLLIAHALAECTPDPALAMRAEVYLGRNRDGAPYVGPARWKKFLAAEVTPNFPGFTVFDGLGYWEGAPERSRVLVILHDASQATKVLAVAEAYRTWFGQAATLVVDEPVETFTCKAPKAP